MKHSERIQRYLDGKLAGEELRKFREDLAKDPELLKELDLYRLIDHSIKDQDQERFREKLVQAMEDDSGLPLPAKHKRTKKLTALRYLTIPAAILIFGMILHTMLGRENSGQEIYTSYYKSYSDSPLSRISTLENDVLLLNGVEHYLNKEYNEALIKFQTYRISETTADIASFYSGLSYAEMGRYSEAISEFEQVIALDMSYFHEHSHWYAALCYIRIEKFGRAAEHLIELRHESKVYRREARILLRKIN